MHVRNVFKFTKNYQRSKIAIPLQSVELQQIDFFITSPNYMFPSHS